MATVDEAFVAAWNELAAADVQAACVGGLAVGVRAQPRTTFDVDWAVAVENDQQAERLIAYLQRSGHTLEAALESKRTGRLATARLMSPDRNPGRMVDLLFDSCGIEREVVAEATLERLHGLEVPVATKPHLIAMKLVSEDLIRRLQDRQDLMFLLFEISDDDFAKAKELAELVMVRGYGRERDLVANLHALHQSANAPHPEWVERPWPRPPQPDAD